MQYGVKGMPVCLALGMLLLHLPCEACGPIRADGLGIHSGITECALAAYLIAKSIIRIDERRLL